MGRWQKHRRAPVKSARPGAMTVNFGCCAEVIGQR